MSDHHFNLNIAARILYCGGRHNSCGSDKMDDALHGLHDAHQDGHADAPMTNGIHLHQHIPPAGVFDGSSEDDDEDDNDSAMGSDGFPSETVTIAPEVTDYRWEYGRRWASESWPPFQHYFPNDDYEMNRYGLINDMIYLALGERRYTAPLNPYNVHHVLDVGCGAGHWCINMADNNSNMQIHGVDLFPIQPTAVPMNCRFEVDDVETYPWSYGYTFDFIHVRSLSGSIGDWARFYTECLHNITPGGWIELQDHDFAIYSHDDSTDRSPQLQLWMEEMKDAALRAGKRLDAVNHHAQGLRDAGFINVTEQVVEIPIGSQGVEDRSLRRIGAMNAQQMADAIPAWTWAFYTRVLSYNAEYVHAFIAGVMNEVARDIDKRCFMRWKFVTAQRPNPSTSRS